ncbi:CCD87 protein, partial [Amia calva]|nr:CCD87 protein [Amia calva]
MAQTAATSRELHQHYRDLLEPLSLFSENRPECEETYGKIQEERPVTPIRGSVKAPPASLSEFCQLIHRRIQVKPEIQSVTEEDQQTLAGIILEEVKLIWLDLKALISDPSLSPEENKDLQCQIVTHIILVCEQLFLHYLYMVDILRQRRVFTDQANLSRLGSQLSTDCTRLLNVPTIRRNVIADIKASRRAVQFSDGNLIQGRALTFSQPPDSVVTQPHTTGESSSAGAHSSQRATQSHPLSQGRSNGSCQTVHRPHESSVEQDLREISEKIADLNLEKVYEILPFQEVYTRGVMKCAAVRSPSPTGRSGQASCAEHHCISKLKASESMPDLHSESLSEELQMKLQITCSDSPDVLLHTTGQTASLEKTIKPAEDLRRLLQESSRASLEQSNLLEPEADLPALIKAMSHRNDSRLLHLQNNLKKLKEEEESSVKEVCVNEPQLPQAAVVTFHLPNKSVARTADVRVSDRVLTDTIEIKTNPPVYNDLTGEIEPSTVKWLDRNLFYGEEIKDVYKELAKSFSTEYLDFDRDPMVEPAMPKADLPAYLASLALTRQRKHRKNNEPPTDDHKPEDVSSQEDASWLQWWKATLNFNEYLKYISSQDSEHLGVIFHLYNSDDSDEEDKQRKALALQLEEKEKMKREEMNALKTQKQAYVAGMWNVNSVLLGGLGKEPVLEAKGQGSVGHSPVKLTARSEQQHLQSRLESIWTALHVPDGERLDMAIKYSSHAYKERLGEATSAWEKAVQFIQQRESLLAKLEQFESNASDPNRFFERGYRGTSIARMDESKQREKLHSQISAVESPLGKAVHHLQDCFHDTVTYKGRPYAEKMRWDRIEMLYWLQQERRRRALERVGERGGGLPGRLPPLHPPQHLQPGTEALGLPYPLTHLTPQ